MYITQQHASVACFLLLLTVEGHMSRIMPLKPAGWSLSAGFLYAFSGCDYFEYGSDDNEKKKSTFDYIKGIRNSYDKPRTKVQIEIKNKKKRRQEEKKLIKEGLDQ